LPQHIAVSLRLTGWLFFRFFGGYASYPISLWERVRVRAYGGATFYFF
jgi:hypothetical protein